MSRTYNLSTEFNIVHWCTRLCQCFPSSSAYYQSHLSKENLEVKDKCIIKKFDCILWFILMSRLLELFIFTFWQITTYSDDLIGESGCEDFTCHQRQNVPLTGSTSPHKWSQNAQQNRNCRQKSLESPWGGKWREWGLLQSSPGRPLLHLPPRRPPGHRPRQLQAGLSHPQ